MLVVKFLWNLPRNIARALVYGYQKTLSPDHSFWGRRLFPGGHCKYTPSCSDYMRFSLEKYGLIRGTLKGFWRILRCNPWSKGGNDLP